MTFARHLVAGTAGIAGLVAVLAVAAVLLLARPVPGPLPFPPSPPISRASGSSTSPAVPSGEIPSGSDAALVLPALAPDVTPQPLPGECLSHITHVDFAMEQTVEILRAQATSVVIGRIGAVGPGRWNTPDGVPPPSLEQALTPVIRLIRLDVDRTVAGDPVDPVIVAWIPGGRIGCQTWSQTFDPGPLAVGDQFAVFLSDRQPRPAIGPVFGAQVLMRIDATGGVMTVADGRITVAEFAARVAP